MPENLQIVTEDSQKTHFPKLESGETLALIECVRDGGQGPGGGVWIGINKANPAGMDGQTMIPKEISGRSIYIDRDAAEIIQYGLCNAFKCHNFLFKPFSAQKIR